MRDEIRKIQELMEAAEYVTDAPVATSVHLAMRLRKPLLIEGPAGVGKTEVAKVMSRMLGTNLIRLQCYEGLDASTALYEWNYQKQLLHIKLEEAGHNNRAMADKEHEIFSEAFLLRRPLLQAITQNSQAPVLLVDEVDRCVAAKTLVMTATGITRAQDVRVGDELVSFSAKQFRLSRSRVRKVIPRHTADVVRVIVGGRFIEVTPEHKFVRFNDEGFEIVRAADLRPSDRLPLAKTQQSDYEQEPIFEFDDNIVKITAAGKALLRAGYLRSGLTYEELAKRVGVSKTHLRNVLQPRSFRGSLRAGVVRGLTAELGLAAEFDDVEHADGLRVDQCVAFYELLGYIVADGCFTSDRLCIADKDRLNLELYSEKFEKAFGVRPRIVPGPHRNFELTHHSLPLGRFLHRVLGPAFVRSRERTLPEFVFALPREKRAAFVRGYFDGEGWVGDHQVCVTSASPYLLAGIQQILGSLGIDGRITKIKSGQATYGKGPYFSLAVADVPAFMDAVGFDAPAKRARAACLRAPAYFRSGSLPAAPVMAALRQICTQRVVGQVPGHQAIYDILSGRIRPNASALGRIAEAFGTEAIKDLLDRGVVLEEVTSVEKVPTAQTVYDFVLDGEPYFVANQIVTHNCDEEFEAFMLEVFSDWQVTIPEIGTIKATHPPHVILTSNRVRELSDALRRRCLYLWIDYPSSDKEIRIISRKVPGINTRLAREVAKFMESLRQVRLAKVPGVAETLDWAQALASLHADHIDEALVGETLGCVLKDVDDMKRFRAEIAKTGLGSFLPTPS
jgi:MoxR-like ATPase/transcriptional regulator with XRE-family HTH domain